MDIDTTNQAKKRTTSSTKLKAQLLALDGMEPCHSLILKWEQISSSHPEKKNASLTLSGVCKIVTNFNILTLQMYGKKYLSQKKNTRNKYLSTQPFAQVKGNRVIQILNWMVLLGIKEKF